MTATTRFILRELANDPHLDAGTFLRLHDLAVELAGMQEPQREAALHEVAVEARRQADDREAAFAAHTLMLEAAAREMAAA